ncbi:MAG: hypothetical protein H7332_10175 [Bdellovibrionales bacterium]|nr:hypothetical protein [Ramlibacter sp.]
MSIRNSSDNAASSINNGVHHLSSESVLQSAEQAVESVRGFTNDSLDRAGVAVRDARSSLSASADQLAARAQELTRKGIAAAAETSAQAKKTINRYADVTGKYVSDQPVKSVIIAAAVGAAVAALVLALRNRD